MPQRKGHHNKVVAGGHVTCMVLLLFVNMSVAQDSFFFFLCEVIMDPEPNTSGEVVVRHRPPPCWALSLCPDPRSDILPPGLGAFLSRDECSAGGDATPPPPWVFQAHPDGSGGAAAPVANNNNKVYLLGPAPGGSWKVMDTDRG